MCNNAAVRLAPQSMFCFSLKVTFGCHEIPLKARFVCGPIMALAKLKESLSQP